MKILILTVVDGSMSSLNTFTFQITIWYLCVLVLRSNFCMKGSAVNGSIASKTCIFIYNIKKYHDEK